MAARWKAGKRLTTPFPFARSLVALSNMTLLPSACRPSGLPVHLPRHGDLVQHDGVLAGPHEPRVGHVPRPLHHPGFAGIAQLQCDSTAVRGGVEAALRSEILNTPSRFISTHTFGGRRQMACRAIDDVSVFFRIISD